jgi:mono/diheme cytochrome c family protein
MRPNTSLPVAPSDAYSDASWLPAPNSTSSASRISLFRHHGHANEKPERTFGGVRVMSPMFRVLAFAGALVVAATDARAQENLDQGQSGAKLFAASCVTCHRSARGLAKGRMSFTLSYYLRQHYTSSAASAQTLTAYLQSVDTPPGKAKTGAKKSQAGKPQPKDTATSATTSRLPTGSISEDPQVRPPAKIPGQ